MKSRQESSLGASLREDSHLPREDKVTQCPSQGLEGSEGAGEVVSRVKGLRETNEKEHECLSMDLKDSFADD